MKIFYSRTSLFNFSVEAYSNFALNSTAAFSDHSCCKTHSCLPPLHCMKVLSGTSANILSAPETNIPPIMNGAIPSSSVYLLTPP